MKIGKNGISLIKYYEQLYLNAYICPAGKPTIGWGCTYYPKGFRYSGNVQLGQSITEQEAEWIFTEVLKKFGGAVNKHFKVPLNQYQFDALVSFAFNLGAGIFADCSFAKAINSWNYIAANGGFEQYCKYKNPKTGKREVARGLLKRRLTEKNLFFYGVDIMSKDTYLATLQKESQKSNS